MRKKIERKYFSACELKEIVLTTNKLPKTNNKRNEKYSFIAKPKGYIFDNFKAYYIE